MSPKNGCKTDGIAGVSHFEGLSQIRKSVNEIKLERNFKVLYIFVFTFFFKNAKSSLYYAVLKENQIIIKSLVDNGAVLTEDVSLLFLYIFFFVFI